MDSSIMDPFKKSASGEQKEATRNAMGDLMGDRSLNSSSIYFDISPQKTEGHRESQMKMVQANNTIEAEVLMVRLTTRV